MSGVAGNVEIAYGADAQNLVPAAVFLKDFQHFFLFDYLFQLFGVLAVGNAQQQSVVVFYDIELADVSRAGNQAAVIVIDTVFQPVIESIELSAGLQQFYLVFHAL